MRLTSRQATYVISLMALGAIWSLLALLSIDFAVAGGAGMVGLVLATWFIAAFSPVVDRRILLFAGVALSVVVVFAVASLLLALICRGSLLKNVNFVVCPAGELDVGFVLLSGIWALVVASVILFTGLVLGKKGMS